MKKCFVDFRTSTKEIENLANKDLEVILINSLPSLYPAICGHPDIQIHIINKSKILTHRDCNILSKPSLSNIEIVVSDNSIQDKYPNNILFNAVNLNNFFIHNTKFTDKQLLDFVKDKTIIDVKQGYTKCSCAVVNNNALITSDIGIYNTLKKYPIDTLYVPTGDISLPGLNYGFIGGCCGLISEDTLAFFGDLKYHSYGKEVEKFLSKHNVQPLYLSDNPLIDRGSILTLF